MRCSTAKSFIRSAKGRDNLHVILHSQVEELLLDDYDGNEKMPVAGDSRLRVKGVGFTRLGSPTIKIRAKREVILSAGSISSPQVVKLAF